MTAIVAIIQARMTSTRLPGKVLADIAGAPMLERQLARTAQARRLSALWVATTVNGTDDEVAALCRRLEIPVYRGDEQDVLGRYHDAAAAAGADIVVRMTADCPLIDPDIIDQVVGFFTEGDYDYASNTLVRTFPDGLDVEVFRREALVEAHRNAEHPYLREHVSPYITGRRPEYGSGTFRRGNLSHRPDLNTIQWSVNLPEDLARIRALWPRLPRDFRWKDILAVAGRDRFLLGIPDDLPVPAELIAGPPVDSPADG